MIHLISKKLILSIFFITLISCNKKTTYSQNNIDNSLLKKVLPFQLHKTDGGIASIFAAHALSFGSGIRPIIPFMAELIESDSDSDDTNPILYKEVKYPECSIGSKNYTDDIPMPFRFSDISKLTNRVVNLSANNCGIAKDEGSEFSGMFFDGTISGKTKSIGDKGRAVISEYKEYVEEDFNFKTSELKNFDPIKYREGLISITGNNSFEEKDDNNGNRHTTIIAKQDIYKHLSEDANATVDGLFYENYLPKGGNIVVKTFIYSVKWTMNNSGTKKNLIQKFPLSNLIAAPRNSASQKGHFPDGYYELDVEVKTPLVIEKGLTFATKGSVSINLKSHNISADIVYHTSYADVTYNNNGKITTVKFGY